MYFSIVILMQVVVRGGGHILPHDQPERAFELIELFVSGKIDKFKTLF